jgi:hypothetical protein
LHSHVPNKIIIMIRWLFSVCNDATVVGKHEPEMLSSLEYASAIIIFNYNILTVTIRPHSIRLPHPLLYCILYIDRCSVFAISLCGIWVCGSKWVCGSISLQVKVGLRICGFSDGRDPLDGPLCDNPCLGNHPHAHQGWHAGV